MKIKYDPQVDAAYISFKKGPTQVTTIRVTEDLAIDFVGKRDVHKIIRLQRLSMNANTEC